MAHVDLDRAGLARLADHVLSRAAEIPLAIGVDAEALAPVRTGELKLSIRVDEIGRGIWRISAGTGLPDGRAVFQELGTSKMPAQPYLRPAAYQLRAL
jgi:hypothetical protein